MISDIYDREILLKYSYGFIKQEIWQTRFKPKEWHCVDVSNTREVEEVCRNSVQGMRRVLM